MRFPARACQQKAGSWKQTQSLLWTESCPCHLHAEVLTAALQNSTLFGNGVPTGGVWTLTQGLPSWLRGDFGHRGRWVEGPGRKRPSGGREVIPGALGQALDTAVPSLQKCKLHAFSVSAPDCDRVTPPGETHRQCRLCLASGQTNGRVVALEKTLESPLDSTIKPINP